jgi:Fibronectin type III domain
VKHNLLFLPLAACLFAAPCRAHAGTGISLSTTAISFNGSSGNVSSQPLTITATARSVSITSASFSSKVFSDGSVTLPVTLERGQTLTLKVVAQPETTASAGKLTITTNLGHAYVSLSETATQPPPVAHQVSLNWSAPANSPVAVSSYEVERAPAGSTQYSSIGSTSASTTSWTDTSVQAGQTYDYQVVAQAADGAASGPSNNVTLTIP